MSRSRFFARDLHCSLARDLRRGLFSVALLAGTVHSRAGGEAPPPPRREATPAEQAALRGAQWLVGRQSPSGAFEPLTKESAPRAGITAMALWALAESLSQQPEPSPQVASAGEAAAKYLLSLRQRDGGIYDPAATMPIYTSAVAVRALEAWSAIQVPKGTAAQKELRDVIDAAQLFVYRQGAPESYRDLKSRAPAPEVTEATKSLLARKEELPAPVAAPVIRALEFLKASQSARRLERPHRFSGPGGSGGTGGDAAGAFTYEDLLRFIYEIARRDNPSIYKAQRALRESYTLDLNPDLTRRYGGEGFQKPSSGIYYYYLTVARTMGALGDPRLETKQGKVHLWSRELADKLTALQSKEGSWVNQDGRWWEDDPVLVTSYALLTLATCQRTERPGPIQEPPPAPPAIAPTNDLPAK